MQNKFNQPQKTNIQSNTNSRRPSVGNPPSALRPLPVNPQPAPHPSLSAPRPGRGDALRIASLGGFNDVNQNMFVYEFLPGGNEKNSQIIILDCGVGFPESDFLGVDMIIPDTRYLEERRDRIIGMVLTHGHEDHIGALPFILPRLPRSLPIFAPRLAAALAQSRLEEYGQTPLFKPVEEEKPIILGPFKLHPIHVTHSIRDTFHFAIETPLGIFYHGTDYKFDLAPLNDSPPNLKKIASFGTLGIKCVLSDCLGADKPEYSLPERALADLIDEEIKNAKGRVFVTTISSNLTRWGQAIDFSKKYSRKIVPVGFSVDRIIKLGRELGYINLNESDILPLDRAKNFPDKNLTFLVAGFAAQPDSALSKITMGKHRIKIKEGDKVIFTSPDYIPGTTSGIYHLIDTLSQLGAEVVYGGPGKEAIHTGGHGGQIEHAILVNLTSPEYLLPIGGNYRHVKQYQLMAMSLGYKKEKVLIPETDQAVTFWENGSVDFHTRVPYRQVLVDGLGIGDVGESVLRDRQTLSQNGVVVVTMLVASDTTGLAQPPLITTRGFVFEKQSGGVIQGIEKITSDTFTKARSQPINLDFVRQQVQAAVEVYIYKETGREPMVLPLITRV